MLLYIKPRQNDSKNKFCIQIHFLTFIQKNKIRGFKVH